MGCFREVKIYYTLIPKRLIIKMIVSNKHNHLRVYEQRRSMTYFFTSIVKEIRYLHFRMSTLK